MFKYVKKLYIVISIFFSALLLSGCQNREESKVGMAMDTIVSISIYDGDCDKKAVLDECFDMIEKYDELFSAYREGSEIYAINTAAGKCIAVSEETADLIKEGIKYSELKDGVFDITGGALIDLWDITGENAEKDLPDDEEIQRAIKTVDYNNIEVNENTIRLKNPDTRINLGGIAKGYVADRLREYMMESDVKSAMINLGGNVVAIGDKKGQPFNIGIPKPFEMTKICHSLKIKDKSVVTSGNYQRYFEKDGVIYHHILDYATGYPSASGLSSVSIICDSSVEADALSTTCFILGYTESVNLLSNMEEDIEAVFVLDNGEVITWKSSKVIESR